MKLCAEDISLIQAMDWVRYNKLDNVIWHVANERTCSPQSGQILKRKGVKAGVSDLVIARPSGKYHGAFIEVKTAVGKLSPAQKRFLEDMADEGYFTAICYSAESTIETIKEYLHIV